MRLLLCWAGLLLAASGAASAEVVEITGKFPAANREMSFLNSLQVERFAGEDGPALSNSIEREFGKNAPFRLIAGAGGADRPEATMSGTVTTRIQETEAPRERQVCSVKDDRGECLRYVIVLDPCWRRVIDIDADVRVARHADDQIIYSKPHAVRNDVGWCQGESPTNSPGEVVSDALAEIAGAVAREVAPYEETYRLRLREKNKGMSKEAAKQFKTLIKASQRNLQMACSEWEVMNQTIPGHPSLLYNLGLCAEQRRDYPAAADHYLKAAVAGAGDAREGQQRVGRLIAAEKDAEERALLKKKR